MTTYVLCKTLVLWLCLRSQPGIKVNIGEKCSLGLLSFFRFSDECVFFCNYLL